MKKSFSCLLALMLAIVLMCSGAIAETTVTLRTWNPEPASFECVKQAWDALETGIEIELEQVQYTDHIATLKVNVASGEGPDIYGIQVGAIMKEFKEFTLELSSLAEQTWGENWKDMFLPLYLEQAKGELDGYYGLPIGGCYSGFIWADNNYFEKYNLKIPTNYDELVAVCKVFREAGEYPLVLGAKDDWINLDMLISIASDVNADAFFAAIEGKGSFTDPSIIEALTIWSNCFKDGVFQDGALGVSVYMDCFDLFSAEAACPLYCDGSWMVGNLAQSLTDPDGNPRTFTVFTMDWNNDGKAAPVAPAVDVVMSINKENDDIEATWKFYSWFVSEGAQIMIDTNLKYLPVLANKGVSEDNFADEVNKNLAIILENGSNNAAGYREINYPELKQVIADELKAIALGEHTPEEAATIMEAASQAQER